MAKKKAKVIKVMEWLNNGIFPGTVLFTCGFNYDEIVALLKKKKADDWFWCIEDSKTLIDSGSCFGLHRTLSNSKTKQEVHFFYIILTNQFNFSDYDMCKLAHEVLHICQFFIPTVLRRDKEIEAEAYYHTHIMSQCLKALRGTSTNK